MLYGLSLIFGLVANGCLVGGNGLPRVFAYNSCVGSSRAVFRRLPGRKSKVCGCYFSFLKLAGCRTLHI